MRARRLLFRTALVLMLLCPCSVVSLIATQQTRDKLASLFEAGQTAHAKGDYDTAVKLYSDALAINSSLYQIYFQRANALVSLGKLSEAERDLRKVIELEPRFARAHRNLGLILLERGDNAGAVNELDRTLELDPTSKGIRVELAGALIKKGENEKAISHLKMASESGSPKSEVSALLGVAYEQSGNAEKAIESYDLSLKENPNQITALEGTARLLEKKGDKQQAIGFYFRLYKLTPSPELAIHIAGLYNSTGSPQDAVSLCKQVILSNPRNINIRVELIRALVALKQSDEAVQETESTISLSPKDAQLAMAIGELFSSYRPLVAASCFRHAANLEPANIEALVKLGASLIQAKKFSESIPMLSKAIELVPTHSVARANIATAYFELDYFQESAKAFEWIVQNHPDRTIAYFFLAISYDRSGNCQGALANYILYTSKADPAKNKREIDDATIRISLLNKLSKEGKCKSSDKGKNR